MLDIPFRSRILLAAGILPLLLLTANCTSSPDESDATNASNASDATTDTTTAMSMAVPDSVNALSSAQKQAGWQLLFDGSSLESWRGFQRDSVPDGWVVENRTMHFTGRASSQDGEPPLTLVTADTYSDFELLIEWKISPDGNSGIMYRVSEEEKLPYLTGPEYQVLDNATLSENDSLHQAGSLYGLYAPATDTTKPIGEFNETRIVVRGPHVEHWLNGTKLLEAEIGSETWAQHVEGTKFANWSRFAQPDSGHIALQDHGHPVWYRDVKIRPLSSGSGE